KCACQESWYSAWTPSPQLPGNSQVCSAPQLPGNSQVGLAHYKKGCMTPPLSVTPASLPCLLPSCSPLPPFPSPISPRGHGQSLLLSPSLCPSLCLYYALIFPIHALNKLYSILYNRVAGPSGRRDALT
ncbi:mCG145954, partial [Mus musculus]